MHAPVDLGAPRSEPKRLYIVEQSGLIRTVVHGKILRRPFLYLRRFVRAGELSGLLSVAFDPAYRRTHRFVVAYVGRDFDLHVVSYRSRAGVAVAGSAHELLHVEMPTRTTDNHFGGSLAFGRDGLLYVGIGDGNTPAAAQDPHSLLGKLVRLDARSGSPKPQIIALGLRNPWRFSFDRATGDLYVGDVGGSAWEEVDYLRHGSTWPVNFGWPAYEGRRRTDTPSAPLDPPPTPPALVYPHPRKGCSAVIGGYVYRGRALPSLRGRYVFGDLCTTRIRSVRLAGGKPHDLRTELRLPSLLSSFGEDSQGELYVFAYTYKLSRLYKLENGP